MQAGKKWLITGGAGYIGAHIANEFLNDGKDIVVFDNLQHGLKARINYLEKKHNKQIPLAIGDIRSVDSLSKTLSVEKFDGIIHTAALKSVAESFIKPNEYFEVNTVGTENIINIAEKLGIKQLIFSSTAAVFSPQRGNQSLNEKSNTEPSSPYGMSKLLAEKVVDEFLIKDGHHGTSLRFFNVIGCSCTELADQSKDNLIPITLSKILNKLPPEIYGNDYDTHDGTCVRDFIDVRDVARAHLLAAKAKIRLPSVMNVGTGHGMSVQEVINLVAEVIINQKVHPVIKERRQGDIPSVYADVALIKEKIGFESKYSILQSIESLKQ